MSRTEITHYFKKLYEMGAVTLYEGNISARHGSNFLITPSQQNKETMTDDMIVEIDAGGNVISQNGYVPSSEYRMHLALYAMREDVKAIVHTHSVYATAYALKNKPIKSDLAELELFFGGEIPCCSYGRPGTDDVFADFERFFVRENKNVVLLARHGLTAVGSSVDEAFSRAETAEKIAKITTISNGL